MVSRFVLFIMNQDDWMEPSGFREETFCLSWSKQYFLFMKDKKKGKKEGKIVTSPWYLTNFRDVTSYFRLSKI